MRWQFARKSAPADFAYSQNSQKSITQFAGLQQTQAMTKAEFETSPSFPRLGALVLVHVLGLVQELFHWTRAHVFGYEDDLWRWKRKLTFIDTYFVYSKVRWQKGKREVKTPPGHFSQTWLVRSARAYMTGTGAASRWQRLTSCTVWTDDCKCHTKKITRNMTERKTRNCLLM